VVEVPWSRSGSGFSLLFEALIMILSREMPVAAVSRLIGESDNRIWRVIEHHVDEARRELDVSDVEHVGMDETSRKRGHNYMTLFVDMDARRVIDVESGMKNLNLETVRSYHIRENFKEFYTREDSPAAEEHLKSWFWWATHSRIEEMREAAWTIKRHWEGVMNWHRSKLSNGLLEALNSLFQAAKAKARGYRSFRKIKTIVYLLLGKLQYKLPELLPT
jgi:transposase